MKSKKRSMWESDSCFICQIMEETEKQGRSPTEEELLKAFAAQKKVNEKFSRKSPKTEKA